MAPLSRSMFLSTGALFINPLAFHHTQAASMTPTRTHAPPTFHFFRLTFRLPDLSLTGAGGPLLAERASGPQWSL